MRSAMNHRNENSFLILDRNRTIFVLKRKRNAYIGVADATFQLISNWKMKAGHQFGEVIKKSLF